MGKRSFAVAAAKTPKLARHAANPTPRIVAKRIQILLATRLAGATVARPLERMLSWPAVFCFLFSVFCFLFSVFYFLIGENIMLSFNSIRRGMSHCDYVWRTELQYDLNSIVGEYGLQPVLDAFDDIAGNSTVDTTCRYGQYIATIVGPRCLMVVADYGIESADYAVDKLERDKLALAVADFRLSATVESSPYHTDDIPF